MAPGKKKEKSPPAAAPSAAAKPRGWEREDLETLGLSVLLIPALWRTLMGWTFDKLIGAHDAANEVAFLKHLLAVKGVWKDHLYRLDSFGGFDVQEVVGTQPLYWLCAQLGLDAVWTASLHVLFAQVLLAVVLVHFTQDLATWFGRVERLTWREKLPLVALYGFLPVLAWRFGYGHVGLALGYVAFFAALALGLASVRRTLSVTLVLVVALAVVHAAEAVAQQTLLYSLVFGLPLVAGLFWKLERGAVIAGQLAVPVLVGVGSVSVALPVVVGMLHHALGPEALRQVGGASVVGSYLVSSGHDLWVSLFLGHEVVSYGRELSLHHESNYPVGPLLLFVPLIAAPNRRALWIGLGLSTVLAVSFATQLPGVSDVLLKLVPVLASFRVSARALALVAALWTVFGAASLVARAPARATSAWLGPVVLLAAVGSVFLPVGAREGVAWGAALALVVGSLRGLPGPSAPYAVGFFAVLSLAAFKDRLFPFLTREALVEAPKSARAQLLASKMATADPLDRVVLGFSLPAYPGNTGTVLEVGNLNGYIGAPARFMRLTHAVGNRALDPTENAYFFSEAQPEAPVIQQLYNVKTELRREGNSVLPKSYLSVAGRAWFSRATVPVADFAQLGAWLRERQSNLPEAVRAEVAVLQTDPPLAEAIDGAACAAATVGKVGVETAPVRIQVEVGTLGASCPLTVAANYSPRLTVTTDQGKAAKTFAAYGALLGVLVPAGTKSLSIVATADVPGWAEVAAVFGWLMLAGAVVVVVRQGRSAPASGS